MDDARGQTAIEYLLIIAAVIVFVAFIAFVVKGALAS
jgi:Flp pilus assembly pilin Flp